MSKLLLALFVAGILCAWDTKPDAPAASSSDEKLRTLAIQDLHTSRFSLAKKAGLCDEVNDESYAPVSFGKINELPDVIGPNRPLPAIVMRHRFVCVSRGFGTKDVEQQWVILALDEEFKTTRCVRTGPLFMIFGLANECKFVPNGPSPFPGAREIADSAPEALQPKVFAEASAMLGESGARPAAAAVVPGPQPRHISVTGNVAFGQGNFEFYVPDANTSYDIDPESPIGKKILAVCPGPQTPCALDATVSDRAIVALARVEPLEAKPEVAAAAGAGSDPAAPNGSPSFDCRKASTDAERLICASADLSRADVDLARAYRAAQSKASDKAALRAAQVDWRSNTRDACADVACMMTAYQTRTAVLRAQQSR